MDIPELFANIPTIVRKSEQLRVALRNIDANHCEVNDRVSSASPAICGNSLG
jgi:hypothetical protein